MGKNTRPLSGQSQRKFFRTMFQYEAGVTPEAVERLTEACAAEIASIRVRLPLIERRGPKPGKGGTGPVLVPSKAGPAAAASDSAPKAADASTASAHAASFDPHAFSLIVVLRKEGADALSSQLAQIADITHLRAIASAQHVSLDASLTDRAAVIAAIVDGTVRRVAHRQAAAS